MPINEPQCCVCVNSAEYFWCLWRCLSQGLHEDITQWTEEGGWARSRPFLPSAPLLSSQVLQHTSCVFTVIMLAWRHFTAGNLSCVIQQLQHWLWQNPPTCTSSLLICALPRVALPHCNPSSIFSWSCEQRMVWILYCPRHLLMLFTVASFFLQGALQCSLKERDFLLSSKNSLFIFWGESCMNLPRPTAHVFSFWRHFLAIKHDAKGMLRAKSRQLLKQ